MKSIRTLAFTVAGVVAVTEAMNNDNPRDGIIEMLPRADIDSTCAELPKLCTGSAMMYGHAMTVTYLCPETTTTQAPSTVHVTITKTTTVTPPESKPTDSSAGTPSVVAPAPTVTEAPDVTTTIHSTLTEYKTITLVRSSGAPLDSITPPVAASITDYISATIPTELVPLPTESEEPVYTIQTSTTPAVTSTFGYAFPTMSPPVVNSTTTGIFYSAPVTNSSLVQPTPFFPNTTSTHAHYTLPTLNVANRAAEGEGAALGAAGKLSTSLAAFVFSIVAVALAA